MCGDTHTSKGYITAHELTPARLPHRNGTSFGCIGAQYGVGPCSPLGKRPIKCRMASYSKKYKEVPTVSRTTRRSVVRFLILVKG